MTPGMVLFAAMETGVLDKAAQDRMAIAGMVAGATKSDQEKYFKER